CSEFSCTIFNAWTVTGGDGYPRGYLKGRGFESRLPTPSSELHSYPTVDVAAIERRPRVNGPPAVDAARRSKQRIPRRLAHVRQVLAIHEQTHLPDLSFDQCADDHVRPT